MVVLGCQPSAVYTTTSPLLIGTTFPEPSTPSQVVVPAYGVVEDEIRLNCNQPIPLVPLSSVSLDVGLFVHIPIFHAGAPTVPLSPIPNIAFPIFI